MVLSESNHISSYFLISITMLQIFPKKKNFLKFSQFCLKINHHSPKLLSESVQSISFYPLQPKVTRGSPFSFWKFLQDSASFSEFLWVFTFIIICIQRYLSNSFFALLHDFSLKLVLPIADISKTLWRCQNQIIAPAISYFPLQCWKFVIGR